MSREDGSRIPPKSVSHVRRLLKSIHNASEIPPAGPHSGGLTTLERKAIAAAATLCIAAKQPCPSHADTRPRTPVRTREQLLRHGGSVGGLAGLLLGLNVGIALPIILGSPWWLAVLPVVALLCGWAFGFSTVRRCIVERRRDLFGPLLAIR